MVPVPARRLVVLLHADIVDSTGLVQLDETRAHQRMQDAFVRFSQAIKEYGGVTHELRGDALIAEFARASDAVCAALAFQRDNRVHNRAIDDAICPELRVGIAMGEVVIDQQTVTGGGVVLAQRLEQLAEPGGVCLQGAIHETVPRRLPFAYAALGEQRLKGFDEPVRAFTVRLKDGAGIPPPESVDGAIRLAGGAAPGNAHRRRAKSTLLLAPIQPPGGDAELDQLAAALEDAVLTALANATGLRLVTGLEDADFELRIGLQMVARRYRATVKLVESSSREQFSSTRFDGVCEDLFETVDQLSFRVATAVRNDMLKREFERARTVPIADKSVEELLSEAGMLSTRVETATLERADRLLVQALELDPENFMALAMRAQLLVLVPLTGFRPIGREAGEQALELLARARELNPRSDFVYLSLSLVQAYYQLDLDAALRSATKSFDLNTAWINPLGMIGQIEIYRGDAPSGIDKSRRAFETFPQSEMAFFFCDTIALGYFVASDYAQAIDWAERAEELQPGLTYRLLLRIALHVLHGQPGRAADLAARLRERHPDFSCAEMRPWPFADKSCEGRLLEGLRAAGLS